VQLAQQLFNVPTRIVRLRATDYLSNERVLGPDCFDVDLAICPEQILTDYIVKLVEFPEALQVLEFAHGKVSLVARAGVPRRSPGRSSPEGPQEAHSVRGHTHRRHISR